jgi:hypothetical protein
MSVHAIHDIRRGPHIVVRHSWQVVLMLMTAAIFLFAIFLATRR